jgi:dephospho-CoA kinase
MGKGSLIIGLTGGIGTGKSTVAQMFVKLGAYLIDSDQIARKIVQQGEEGWEKIRQVFGPAYFLPDGQLNRGKLAQLIFRDPQARAQLDQITHPLIRKEIMAKIKEQKSAGLVPVVIVDIPLLYEVGAQHLVDQVVVVFVPPELQLERLMQRDNLTREEAKDRIQAQMSLAEKIEKAQIVIDNSQSRLITEQQVRSVWWQWMEEYGSPL